MLGPRRARSSALLALALALAVAPGCQATGKAANGYFDWGGRVFTTNPASVGPYFLGFALFYVAALPLDLFSWLATYCAWHEGGGEDYQASCLAPSLFLGTTGGVLLGAPFFPFGLPWWDPDREDDSAPAKPAKPEGKADVKPADPAAPRAPKDASPAAGSPSIETPTSRSRDDGPTAGSPGR